MENTRLEHDLLGESEVPAERYFGNQTLSATENFAISGIPISHHPHLIRSLAGIKKATALVNQELGLLDPKLADAIAHACHDLLAGNLLEEFVVDVIQGGLRPRPR
jgi:aspartate ammonia-lyase